MIVQRRVIVIHSSPVRPMIRAAMAKAKGTVKPVKPEVERHGMGDHARVLEQRVEPAAVGGTWE